MPKRKLIKTEALIVGYAMARLGPPFLAQMGWRTWTDGFASVSASLGEKHNSIKLLRDEFDVFFPNGRRGWLLREPHPSRLAILHEFSSVSDAALVEIVKSILSGDKSSVEEVVGLVSEPPSRVANVAERLLTGKLAEEHFMQACKEIVNVPPDALIDMRHRACGYDFEAVTLPGVAIEVKGLKQSSGGILFTDREWSEADFRRTDYWLVVVGDLSRTPRARVTTDPTRTLDATCVYRRSVTPEWRVQTQV